MDDLGLLGIGIRKEGRNYTVDAQGAPAGAAQGATWERTLGKLVQDKAILDDAAGKEMLAKKGDVVLYKVINLWKFIPGIARISEKSKVACDITIIRYGVISTSAGGELFCTYGHDHAARLGEIYSVLAGKASLVMYLPGSNLTRVVRMGAGDEYYIPPDWVHRTYCGDEGTVLVGFVPHEAGHRYETVKGLGFPYHVFYDERTGKTTYKRNPKFEKAELEVLDAGSSLGAVRKYFENARELMKMLEREG